MKPNLGSRKKDNVSRMDKYMEDMPQVGLQFVWHHQTSASINKWMGFFLLENVEWRLFKSLHEFSCSDLKSLQYSFSVFLVPEKNYPHFHLRVSVSYGNARGRASFFLLDFPVIGNFQRPNHYCIVTPFLQCGPPVTVCSTAADTGILHYM